MEFDICCHTWLSRSARCRHLSLAVVRLRQLGVCWRTRRTCAASLECFYNSLRRIGCFCVRIVSSIGGLLRLRPTSQVCCCVRHNSLNSLGLSIGQRGWNRSSVFSLFFACLLAILCCSGCTYLLVNITTHLKFSFGVSYTFNHTSLGQLTSVIISFIKIKY